MTQQAQQPQQAPEDEEQEVEDLTPEEIAEIEKDPNLDRFSWKEGDVVVEENVWDVSFQTPDGTVSLIQILPDFIRYLQVSELTLTEFMHFDVAEFMPDDLKEALENRIGRKVEYLGRNKPGGAVEGPAPEEAPPGEPELA